MKKAFTMMELIFVIVIVGVLSKFGVEFMAQAYKGFIFSKINNTLQGQSSSAVEFISKRLSYRIKDSVIARKSDGTYTSVSNATGSGYTILEWIGSDSDNFRGDTLPNYSSIIDLNASTASNLHSPDTDTTSLDTLIKILSQGNSSLSTSALYFIGSGSDITTSYGWTNTTPAFSTQKNVAMHPIQAGTTKKDFSSSIGVNFSGVDVFEYYKLAWTAYAIVYNTTTKELRLYYDYQPWAGESYNTTGKNIKSTLIMENVSTFKFGAIGSLIKVQVCVQSQLTGEKYSICKEKTVY